MKANDVLRKIVRESGKSAISISREIGRRPNYVSSLLHSGSIPSCETFATIAEACGAKLQVVKGDMVENIDGWEVPEVEDEH